MTQLTKCGSVEASCVCVLPDGHDAHHHCECGGEWFYDDAGEFHAVTLPGMFGGMGPMEALGALIDMETRPYPFLGSRWD
jgi:hypothetical protein